jgi:nicotinamidase-related amidase
MEIDETILLVVDVQGNLANLMHEHERLFSNIERMIRIAKIMGMPILWTEQAPDKIGVTVEPIAALLRPDLKPIPKRSFSCYPCIEFKKSIDAAGRRNVLITGIETHVCVYQTARDMHRHGYNVHLLEDAVSSRTENNKRIAIERMRGEGITITSAEMAVTELLGGADHPKFRDVMANIKR